MGTAWTLEDAMKKAMDINLGRILLVGALFSLSGCVIEITDPDFDGNAGDEEASALVSKVLPVNGQTVVRILGQNGSIRVRGVEGADEVTVLAERRVRSDTRADAQEHLHLLQVSFRTTQDVIRMETEQPSHTGGRDYIVDYEVTVPIEMAVVIANGNGSVRLENLRADAEVEVGNGNVDILALEGSSWVTAGNGQVEASVTLPLGGVAIYAVGNGSVDFVVQRQASADLSARIGNGSISVSGLNLVNPVSAPNLFNATLGSGDGTVDISVGNGWVKVKGR